MLKKLLSLLITGLLLNLAFSVPVVQASTPAEKARWAAKVKAKVAQLGIGPEARIEVKLRDKTKIKGYVSEITDEHFVVIDRNTNAPTTVPYTAVKQVKGNNLSYGVKIAIGVVVTLFVLALIGSIDDD